MNLVRKPITRCPAPPVATPTGHRVPSRAHRPNLRTTPVARTFGFYLSPTPRLEPFKHPANQAGHRTTKCGRSSPSCVSHALHDLGHAAIGMLPRGSLGLMSGGQAGIVSSPHDRGPISEGRTQKLPLTHRSGRFAVAVGLSTAGNLFGCRLPDHLPASPCATRGSAWAFRS